MCGDQGPIGGGNTHAFGMPSAFPEGIAINNRKMKRPFYVIDLMASDCDS
jgi:hypothetical protein